MKNLFFRFYILIIVVLLFGYSAKINWGTGQWERVIQSDAKGYYAYLPAIFIYNDLNFDFYDEVDGKNAYDSTLVYEYRTEYEGRIINKYFIGEAVILTPFFLMGHWCSSWTNSKSDGYSKPYVISITVAALFYLLLGLISLQKSLVLFGFSRVNIMISIIVVVLGTNLFYYCVGEMAVSHVYSFSFICVFIYFALQYFRTVKTKYFLWCAFFLGIIILIRPINGLIILSLPFLSTSKERFKLGLSTLGENKKVILYALIITLGIVFIQPLIYKLQTGSFFLYSYGEEGFNFASPSFLSFLFSYKKGFFIYTPIALIALFGLLFLWKDRFRFFSLLLFLFILVYILSSWWNWYYGGSFSSRVMVDYLPFFAILLCYLFEGIHLKFIRFSVITLLFILLIVNQIQTLQYRYYLIHWSEMTKEKYWDVFLDIDSLMKQRKIK